MTRALTTKQFIAKAKAIHGDRYDYSRVIYYNSHTKVRIICSIHGVFEQRPRDHIYDSNGCPKCSGNVKSSIEEFIEKANIVHNNKYDYSLVEYVSNKTKVKINCNIHGTFEQCPVDHIIRANGCSKCSGKYRKSTNDFIQDAIRIHGE